MLMEQRTEYKEMHAIASFLQKRTEVKPVVGIICGSGLGGLVDELDAGKRKDVVPYKDIDGFPECSGEARNYPSNCKNAFICLFIYILQ